MSFGAQETVLRRILRTFTTCIDQHSFAVFFSGLLRAATSTSARVTSTSTSSLNFKDRVGLFLSHHHSEAFFIGVRSS